MAAGKRVKIIIAGEGGQGVQSIGELLAEAAFQAGQQGLYIPNFGVEQRGGVSIAFVQIATDGAIGAPKFQKADLLAVLSERSAERTQGYLKPGCIYLYDQSAVQAPTIDDQALGIQGYETVAPEGFAKMVGAEGGSPPEPPTAAEIRVVGIPAAQIAKAELTPRVFNIIILGAIVRLLDVLDPDQVKAAIATKFGKKFRQKPELETLNYQALEQGLALGLERQQSSFER
jgi:2-oxoglutarate ferredoxin oxidoreductase subunit gamma